MAAMAIEPANTLQRADQRGAVSGGAQQRWAP
jgi:hypothetical protein